MTDLTHKEIKNPQISARDLADFMAAGARERAKRSIIRNSKFRPIARLIQHNHAKVAIASFYLDEKQSVTFLKERADRIRNRIADTPFEEDTNKHNSDYIERFSSVCDKLIMPKAEFYAVGRAEPLVLNGVRVTTDICFGLRRLTRTNEARIGVAALRYSKGTPLSQEAALWHAAYLYGYLARMNQGSDLKPDRALCVVIDAYSGVAHLSPSDSVTRFREMEAACETIAERWPKIAAPPRALIK